MNKFNRVTIVVVMSILAGMLILSALAQDTQPGTPVPPPTQTEEPQLGPPYAPFPADMTFPAPEATLAAYRENQDMPSIRAHMWGIWEAMNSYADPTEDTLIWETWYRSSDIFVENPTISCTGTDSNRILQDRFEPLAQHEHSDEGEEARANLSFVMYNQPACKHILDNKYYLLSTFDALLSNSREAIVDFPNDSISIKALFLPVNGKELSPMPVWDRQPTQHPVNGVGNPIETWARIVLIDVTNERAGQVVGQYVMPNGTVFTNVPVVGLNEFYSVQINESDITAINSDLQEGGYDASFFLKDENGPRQLESGDYAVLMAMHLTTKELPGWAWASFWWHDQPNTGDMAQDRPDTLRAPFNHYLMVSTFDMVTPVQGNGEPIFANNPYLEAEFVNGINANCMSCHRLAAVRPLSVRESADTAWQVAFQIQGSPEEIGIFAQELNAASDSVPEALVASIRNSSYVVPDNARVEKTAEGWLIYDNPDEDTSVNFLVKVAPDGSALDVLIDANNPYPPIPIGEIEADRPFFDGALITDFLWSLPMRAWPTPQPEN